MKGGQKTRDEKSTKTPDDTMYEWDTERGKARMPMEGNSPLSAKYARFSSSRVVIEDSKSTDAVIANLVSRDLPIPKVPRVFVQNASV
jgi:hypothetical protein